MAKVNEAPKSPAPVVQSTIPPKQAGEAKRPGTPSSWLPPASSAEVCHAFPSNYFTFTKHPTAEGILAHRHDAGVASGMSYRTKADMDAHRNGTFMVWDASGKVWLKLRDTKLPPDVRAEYEARGGGLRVTVGDCRDFGRAQDFLEQCNHALAAGTAKRLDAPPFPASEANELDDTYEHYTVATDADLEREAYSIGNRIFLRERVPSKHSETWFEIAEDPPPIPAARER